MAITPESNATLNEIAEAILNMDSFCICGHLSPDGDCVGSVLAMRLILDQLDKPVDVLLADSHVDLDKKFLFLEGAQAYVKAKDYKGDPQTFIALDVPSIDRLGKDAAEIFNRCHNTIIIDHHVSQKREAKLYFGDDAAASATELVWKLAKCLDVKLDKDIAMCALSGLMTDTGSFQYQNADSESFILASEMVEAGASPNDISNNLFQSKSIASIELEMKTIGHMEIMGEGRIALSWLSLEDLDDAHAKKTDCDSLINTLRSIDGVEIACMLREEQEGVRGSLRAKGDIDVASIANEFGGGGHKAAAGFTYMGSLSDARDELRRTLLDIYGDPQSNEA